MLSILKPQYFMKKINRFTNRQNFFSCLSYENHNSFVVNSPSSIYINLVSEISNRYVNPVTELATRLLSLSFGKLINDFKNSLFVTQSSVVDDLTLDDDSIWSTSTLKRRRSKMNKHKLRKRRKLLQKNTKISRGK